MNTSDYRRFGGISRLFGKENFDRLTRSHVTVVGVGGVGSWAVEALARTGIGRLTLIDGDTVAPSNTNRQLPAMEGNFGQKKVLVLRERLMRINPQLQLSVCDRFLNDENMQQYLPDCDCVLDCIDSLSAKAALIAYCVQRGLTVMTSGGAGGKKDPARIRYADLSASFGDPLLSALRTNLRKHYGFAKAGQSKKAPLFGVGAVFSDEPVLPSQDGEDGFGVFMPVTASFGMLLAQKAVLSLLAAKEN